MNGYNLQIKERSKIIFGTADKLRCKIMTSNDGFIRAAAAQGVTVAAITHQSRALSEQKRLEESAKSTWFDHRNFPQLNIELFFFAARTMTISTFLHSLALCHSLMCMVKTISQYSWYFKHVYHFEVHWWSNTENSKCLDWQQIDLLSLCSQTTSNYNFHFANAIPCQDHNAKLYLCLYLEWGLECRNLS